MKFSRTIRNLIGIMLIGVVLGSAGQLLAQESGLVTVTSKMPFDETVASLRKMVAKNQMMVLAEINHGKILSMTGLKLNGIALFIGNPTIGKKLFTANRGVGIAVPVRVNVFEGTDGKTYVNYVKPSVQLAAFPDPQIQMIAKKLDEKLAQLTGMLAQ